MARSHGRIYADAWVDPDFQDLTPAQQRMFFLLLSQPMLNLAGLLPWQPKRWALASKHTSVSDILDDLAVLTDHRYVVISLPTEELLIRSYSRRDVPLWNEVMVTGLKRHIPEIQSTSLRHALAVEVSRARLDLAKQIEGAKNPAKLHGLLDDIETALTRHRAADQLATPDEVRAACDADPGLGARLGAPVPAPVPARLGARVGGSAPTEALRLDAASDSASDSASVEALSTTTTSPPAPSDQEPSSSSTEDETPNPLDQLATDLETALGRPIRFDPTPTFTAIDRTRLTEAITRHGTAPYVVEAQAASNGRGPADHAAAYLPRWRALTESLDRGTRTGNKPKPVTCPIHHVDHPPGAICPGCRADHLAGDQPPLTAPQTPATTTGTTSATTTTTYRTGPPPDAPPDSPQPAPVGAPPKTQDPSPRGRCRGVAR